MDDVWKGYLLGVVPMLIFMVLSSASSDEIVLSEPLKANIELLDNTFIHQYSDFSPSDRFEYSDLTRNSNGIAVRVPEFRTRCYFSTYTDTNSMLPTLDASAHGLNCKPKNASEIKVGDIITFELNESHIVHRVIGVLQDEEGLYFKTKGDNMKRSDGIKVRFEQIRGVLIAIFY